MRDFSAVFRMVILGPVLCVFVNSFSAFNFFDPKVPPALLSATGLYTAKTIDPAAVPYDVNIPQWTDSIKSFRYVLVKPGVKIPWDDTTDLFQYPDGVAFVRTLYFDKIAGDPNTRAFLETRLLMKEPAKNHWVNLNYRWKADQSDAYWIEIFEDTTLTITRGGVPVTQKWRYDGEIGCIGCHDGRMVNGFFPAQLNRPSVPNPAVNQITFLFSKGIFSGDPPANPAALVAWPKVTDNSVPVEKRARAYLASQCSQCHGHRGPEIEGKEWSLDYHHMVVQDTIAGEYTTFSMGNDCFIPMLLQPGDPGASVLFYRQTLRPTEADDFEPNVNVMPPATSFQRDTRGLSVVYDWICQMNPTLCSLPVLGKLPDGTERCPDPDISSLPIKKEFHKVSSQVTTGPFIKNRVLYVPNTITTKQVIFTDVMGKEYKLRSLTNHSFHIGSDVPTGVYSFKIREKSYKRVVFKNIFIS